MLYSFCTLPLWVSNYDWVNQARVNSVIENFYFKLDSYNLTIKRKIEVLEKIQQKIFAIETSQWSVLNSSQLQILQFLDNSMSSRIVYYINNENIYTCSTYDNFADSQKNNWIIVNDWVMGWLSKWSFTINNTTLTFSGNINTNWGGFTSIRWWVKAGSLDQYEFIRLVIRKDTRSYKITLRDNNRRGISHQAELPGWKSWEFEEVLISLDTFQPTFFWRTVTANDFQKDQVRQLGFIISDGINWPFWIEIAQIDFCKK